MLASIAGPAGRAEAFRSTFHHPASSGVGKAEVGAGVNFASGSRPRFGTLAFRLPRLPEKTGSILTEAKVVASTFLTGSFTPAIFCTLVQFGGCAPK